MPYIFILVDGYLDKYICQKYSDVRKSLFSLTYISEEELLKINNEAKQSSRLFFKPYQVAHLRIYIHKG